MSSFWDRVDKVNEQKKVNEVEEKKKPQESSSSSFWDRVDKINNGYIVVNSSMSAKDVTNWASGASSVGQRAYNFLKTDGYKLDDKYESEINSYLDQANHVAQYLRANKNSIDNYDELISSHYDTVNYLKQLRDGIGESNKFYSKWDSADSYNAEKQAAERQAGYFKNYYGKTSTELQALIDSMEDGEEKDWLKSYENIVGRNELLSVGNSSSENYDPNFDKYVAAGKEYLYMDDAEYNRRVAEYDDMYFNADTNEERQVALSGLNALKYQYNNIKRTAPNFEGLDAEEQQVYLYHLGKDLETGTMDFSDTFYEELTGRKNNAASNKTLNFFQNLTQAPELLEDGFDWYDALLIPLGTVADLGVGLVKGAVNTVEGIVDYAGYGVAGVADLLGADGFADSTRDAMRWSFTDSHLGGISDFVDQASISGSSLDMLAEGVGQVLSVGKITKAGQAALNLGKVGTTVLSSLLTFSSSAGLGITEAYESGVNVTDAEAFAYGTMAGTAEALSELLWSGAGKLFNKIGIAGTQIGLDELVSQNVAKVFSGTFGRNVAQYMIGGAFEGVEGLASGFLQAVAKKLTYLSEEDFADIIANENLMEQFIAEALTSFLVQSPDLISKTKADRDLITGLTDSETFLLDTEFDSYLQDSKAEGYDLNEKQQDELYEKAQNIISKLGEVRAKEAKQATKDAKEAARKSGIPTSGINPTRAKSLTKEEVREILAANNQLITAEDTKKIQAAAEERLKSLGQTKDVQKLAELATKYATGQKLSKADKAFLANNKNGNRVANELIPENIMSGEYTSEWAEGIGTKQVNKLAYNIKNIIEQMQNPATYKSLGDRIDENESVSVSDNGKATISGTDEEISIDKKVEVVDFIRDKKTGKITDIIINANGKQVKASEIDFADADQAYLFSAVKHIENITPADATAFVRGYDSSLGISVGEYLNGIDEAYTYGYHGYTEADMKSGLFTTKLSDEKAKGAYELGKLAKKNNKDAKSDAIKRMRTAVEAETEKTVAEGKPAPEPKKMAITYNEGNGVVREFDNEAIERLPDNKRAGVEVARILHKLGLGTNFEFFESFKSKKLKVKDKKTGKLVPARVFINEAGVEEIAPAGVYMKSDGTIRVDLNAYNGRGLTLYALAHELTHFIEQWSPEKYEILAEYLVSTYYKTGITMHQRVLREQARLTEIRKKEISYNEAYHEVVANAMMKMFDDGNLVQRLTELKAKDKDLAMKLWEGIKDIFNKLLEFLNVYQSDPGVFRDTKDLMQMKEDFEVLQGMFAEALVDASENFQANLSAVEVGVEPVAVEDVSQFSYSSLAEAAGFEAVMNDDGTRSFTREGKKVSKVTIEDIENSPIGAFINFSLEMGDISKTDADRQKKMFADICTMACKTNDFAMTMQFVGSAVFTGMKANADKQYGTTYDFPSICTKTQAVIDAMSAKMVSLGRGLTTDEIVQLYDDVFASGNPVPCPECYVFSRWIGIGGLLDNIKKYQDYYGDMDVKDVADAYLKMKAEVSQFAEEHGISFGKAKGAMTSKFTKEFNNLTEKIEKAENQGEKVKPADRQRLAELEPMMNTVKAMTWLENVYFADSSLKKVNPNFRVPNSVLFDLNNGEAFATKYKEAWAFRTTQGAGYGKAITPYAEARLGEGVLVTNNTTNAIKGKARGSLDNYFLKQMGKLDKNSRAALKKARLKQLIQAFIGGQRFQSTSDARYENASDYLLAALEMQAMRGMVQAYTKVDGAVPAFSAWGFSINQSLMPLNGGLDANGNIKDTAVGGMKPEVAFKNREKHESAGTITIGVNDNHIRAMFKQWVRDFIIPYHASGGKADVVAEFRRIQEGKEAKGKAVRSTDYSRTQSDKILSDDVLRWQGKTDAQIQRIHEIRAARIAILTGGKPNMTVVRSNRFLSALYDKLNGGEWDGVKLAKSKVESQIFPNEFWDQTVTYDESAKITKDYLEYCEDLGFLHRFSGMIPSNGKLVPVNGYNENGERVQLTDLAYKYDENGNKTAEVEEFFWKVLTDRRMYDNNGNYLAQKVVTLNDTTTDTVTGFAKNNQGRQYDKAKAEALAKKIVGEQYSSQETDADHVATVAVDFVSYMRGLVKANGGWYAKSVFKYVEEHPELDFIERIYEKDKQVKKDLASFLDKIDDTDALEGLSWFMGEAYGDKGRTWTLEDGASYPYRGAVRTFRNAVKKRINTLMTEKVGGTNLGIKNGEVTLDEVKDLFKRLNSNEEIGQFAEKVFATAEKLGVNIRFVNKTLASQNVAGDNIGDMVEYKTSYFNDTTFTDQRKASTILHELIHACTVYVMHKNTTMGDVSYGSSKSENYNRIANAATRLNRIYFEISYETDFQGQYGIKSAKEMVAELANEEFVGLLKKKNLFDKIVDWICDLFGIRRGTSAYDNARLCLDYILDNPEVSEYKAHAMEQRGNARYNGMDVFGQTRYSSQETDVDKDFDYSDLNWASDLGIITAKDRAIFERTINNEIYRGAKPQSANGEYIIDTGKCLMFTDGDFHSPTLSRVIVFDTEYESLLDEAKRRMLYEARNTGDVQASKRAIENIYGPGFAIEYTQSAHGANAWKNRGRKGSNGSRTGQRAKAKSIKEMLAAEGKEHLLLSSQETDADNVINSLYNYDTVNDIDKTVIDWNLKHFAEQWEKGYYSSVIDTIAKQTGKSKQEAWNAFAGVLMKKEGIAKMDGKTYINVHELNEENLRKAFELGGLAAPSIGIVDVDSPVTHFGDIAIIFPDIFSPETNPTYYGDSYSSSFPAVGNFTNSTMLEDALTYGLDGMEWSGILSQEEIYDLIDELDQVYFYDDRQRTSHSISRDGFANAKEFARNYNIKSIPGLRKLYDGLRGGYESFEDFLEDFAEKAFTNKRMHRTYTGSSDFDFDARRYQFKDYNLENVVDEMTTDGDKDFRMALGEKVDSSEELLSNGMRARLKAGSNRFYEVKPQRAVYFDEASYAVVPENTSADVIGMLEFEGVKVVKYQRKEGYNGIAEGRAEAIKGILESDTTGIRYSTQETDNISNRDMLANAFETLAQNSEEYKMIQDYKNHIRLLNEYEEKLSKLNAEIREITFGTEGERDYKRLRELQAKAKEMAGHINRHDKKLIEMEASAPLRKVIEQERKKEAQKTREHIGEILQNKKARAEQTEYRHKIRKVIRDLDKLLKNGNKKQNVKEDMKGFVSKALELADYLFQDHVSNDDLIRKGITVPMRGNEAQLVKETEEILNKLYDEADSLTDEEFTRLDAKRKRNLEKLRDLLTEQRNERLRTPVYKLFDDLVTEYASLKNSSQESVKAAYDPNIERFLRSYIGETDGETDSDRKTLLQNMRVADMTTDELWKLYNAYTMVLKSVRDANKLHVKGRTESIEQMVTQIVMDFGKRNIPDKKLAIVARNLSNKIGWDYEKLHYALDRIGSNAFTELIMNLADSENIVMRDVIEAAEFRDQIVEKYGFNNWDVNKEIDREFLDNTGKKFKLTLGELMSLYAYSRRDGAWDHIEYGGFVFGEKALTNPKPADSYKLSKAQCEAITNTLTKEQKAYVEDMQKFLSETMGAKGNEVSMELYGIKMFGEKNYFPIHIAGQFKAQAQESQAKQAAGFGSMSNAGFTHAQNPNAKAPFVLEAFNDVWADHVNEMSRYHGTVPALEDIRRVMNRSSYSESTAESTSVKAMMENYFGKEAVDYFDNLYREANSGAITDKMQRTSKWFLSFFRKGSVAYSLSVLVQQPASIVRAYAMIDRKYFGVKGMGVITSGVAKAVTSKWNKAYANSYNEMLKYAPGVTMAKDIGGFDTATGGSIRSYLLDTGKSFKQKMKTENLKGKGKAVMDLVDDNAIANLPNVADKIAWIEIWNACKRETAANHKDLATSSDEFMQIVGERFTEVIRATQVYDSIFAKSPMLKSKTLAVQYLVSFMNEPNTVANMAESAVRDLTKGNVKQGLRKSHVLIHSIIFTSILKSMIYAMRDDDEDETYIEKYIEAITGSLMDDFNALNYIPFARDVWSVAQGYDVERADMAIVSDAISALNNVIKNRTKDTDGMTEDELVEFDKKATEASWDLVVALAGLVGIPAKNIRREINGVIDHARIASANAGQTTAMSAWDKVRDAVIDSIPFMSNDKTKNDKLYSAIVNGDTAYVDRMKDTYKTEDAYHNAVRKALRENDSRIKEAALAEIGGNPSERVRIARLIIADGFVQDDVVAAINSEINALTPKEEDSGTDKKKGFYTTENLVREFVNGDTTSAKAAKSDIISTAIANGKTKEQAEKDFMSSVSSSAKEAYENNWLSESKAKKLLMEYAGEDEDGATSKVNYWTLCKLYPKYKDLLTESRTEKYHEFVKPAGISMDMYAQFLTKTKDLADIKDANGKVKLTKQDQVIDVIDALPITRRQKNALFLAAGYKESTLSKVRWS